MVEKQKVGPNIADAADSLVMLSRSDSNEDATKVVDALKTDKVILFKGISSADADSLMFSICQKLGLQESLQLQASFASSMGHRENIGNYYMSVNKRDNFQFVTPHSEGNSFTNMQLASFFCHENSTDGGETVLMHVNQDTDMWNTLREKVRRGRSARPLTQIEINQIRVRLRLNMPQDELKPADEVLSKTIPVPGFELFEVLTKPRKTHSVLLDQQLYSYWDDVDNIDLDSADEFYRFLQDENLLKLPQGQHTVKMLDADANNRIREFGKNKFEQLFDGKIVYKMQPGDFIIQNNLSWTHAVNNWTPNSGVRKVAAAFA